MTEIGQGYLVSFNLEHSPGYIVRQILGFIFCFIDVYVWFEQDEAEPMEIDPDLEAVQTLLSFSRAARQQEAAGDLPSSGSSSDESQDQWDASSDDGYHKTHLQSAKV